MKSGIMDGLGMLGGSREALSGAESGAAGTGEEVAREVGVDVGLQPRQTHALPALVAPHAALLLPK